MLQDLDIRGAIYQQLRSDQLLGVKSVPIAAGALVGRVMPTVTPADPRNSGAPTWPPPARQIQTAAPAPQKPQTHVWPPPPRQPQNPATPARPAAQPASLARATQPARAAGDRGELSTAASGKAERLKLLDESSVRSCRKCELCNTRTQTVFGQGNPDARLVFVGEAPGYEEDKQGLAFVGAAGQLLSKMITAMGLTREDVFICNVLKCRPPGNRDPLADEILACSPYLREQLQTIQPDFLIALGAPAAKTLLNTAQSIGKLRGYFHEYFLSGITGEGPSIPLMPTYHPAYLLRNPEEKGKAWADLQMVMERMGLAGARKA